jgi:S1-C subfamily serine protease
MNLLDLLVLVLLAVGAVAGARAGFLAPVLGLGGGLLGLALAIVLATVFRPQLTGIEQPTRALVTLLALGMLVLVGEATGAALGATASRHLRASWFRSIDSVGGAVVGAAHVLLLTWVLAGVLAAGMLPSFGAAARDSVAVRLMHERLPSPGAVAGGLLALLDTTDLPPLFAGLEPEPAAPVELPADAEARALAESAIASTARVTGVGCGVWQQVGSGFFIGPSHLVTNAHVVAGTDDTSISLGGSVHQASVVLFDPDSDLALLHVPNVNAPALQLSGLEPQRGQTAVALGFPGGGELTVSPAAVTTVHHVQAPDIYGDDLAERSIVEVLADLQRGNSGGPLVIAPGVVGGVVYGESRTAEDVGYAISSTQAVARLTPALGSTQPVDTGPCG